MDIIDRVYCITLEDCGLRQINARDQLSKIGVDDFEFFWGTGKNDALVSEFQDAGLVLDFPPCFRCGKRSCGSETCNNFLIPAQIATFITYKRLWEDMVANNIGVALIVEDDFVFTDYGPALFQRLLNKESFLRLGITPESESLVRLGWFRCDEHREIKKPRLVKDLLRMSNPCHIITRGMASRLLGNFKRIESPVDTYIHEKIGLQVNNYTMYPPIAFDLSWSAGAVESLIHPKPVRVQFLQQFQSQNDVAIESAMHDVVMHFMHKLVRPVLCVGHPRCGSGYMSQLLSVYGLDVGHEEMKEGGISSWMFAVDDEKNPYALNKYALSSRYTVFDHVIQHVRDPRDCVPSILRENRHSEKSYTFRKKHIRKQFNIDLDEYKNDIDRAVASLVLWNDIIEQSNPDIVVKVEECERKIYNYLESHGLAGESAALSASDELDKTYNSDKNYSGEIYEKPVITKEDWLSVDDQLWEKLACYCGKYGYDRIER